MHESDRVMPRTRNIFDHRSSESFKLSRSKLELFLGGEKCVSP